MTARRIVRCACCGSRGRFAGRGLIDRCWSRHFYRGTLDQFERELRRTSDVYAEWQFLREDDPALTKRQAAERLGMTFAAFDRALQRARTAQRLTTVLSGVQ